MTATILVVDDDVSVTTSLALLLKQAGFKHLTAADPQTALALLGRQPVDLVIQDMNFARTTTGGDGLELLREIRARHAGLPIVLITAWGSIPLAVAGMKAGATDFVTKPWDNSRLVQTIKTALSLVAGRSVHLNRAALDQVCGFGEILGNSPALIRVLNHAARIAKTDATVLITGESGTGKELLANAIHKHSSRAAGPLVKVNMGGIVSSLFESEMFGHVRGAFTDAKEDRAGYFERAHRGTIFLDEIAELDPSSQVKLLRVLQDREFRRVGSSELRKGDFRVIAATNRDLPRLVAQRAFREDLYYRLNLITLELPALRARKQDIVLIASEHLRQVKEHYELGDIECEDAAYAWLAEQPWPGNVRELKHCIERAALLSDHAKLTRADFLAISTGSGLSTAAAGTPGPERLALDEVEKTTIQKAMTQAAQNITRAAELLGLSRAALYRRLAKYGLVRE